MQGWCLTSLRDEKSFHLLAVYIFSSRHRKQQAAPTTNISYKPALCASWVTGAQFFDRPTRTPSVWKSPSLSLFALSLCKLSVYSNTIDAVSPDWLNKRGTAYCDLLQKLCRCQGETWIKKSRRKDISNASWSIHIWKGKMYSFKHLCGYRATSTNGNETLNGFSHPWSCLCRISDRFFLSSILNWLNEDEYNMRLKAPADNYGWKVKISSKYEPTLVVQHLWVEGL